ncbi:hypothetical protein [Exiguobacterium flavidum]|uniref:hypothetical protein n=1 Tax=Exiguobacterium flavidum TaxID=2184695 RepID=UPI000DF75F01|nr:hypothetical protein [Exiguobacterium flavidum]
MTYTRKSKKLYATAAALAVTASAVAPGLQAGAASSSVTSISTTTIHHYGGYAYAIKKLSLPKTVKVKLSNGKYTYRSVKWAGRVSFDSKKIDKYQYLYGTVAGTSKKAVLKIMIKDYPIDVIEPKLASVYVGGTLVLPKTVAVKMKSGKVVQRTIVVSKPDTSKAGKFYLTYSLSSTNSKLTGKIAYEVKAAPVVASLSVKALSKSKLEVTFKDAVDSVHASNFTIEGARVNGADISADGKKAILEVHDLEIGKEYTLEIKGVPINGKRTDLGSVKFQSISAQALWDLKVIPKKSSIIADGATSTEVEFALYDKTTGQIDVNADNLVLEVSSSHGSFSNITKNRITLQNGKATGVLRSEASSKALDVKISAEVMEASGDYKALIGKVLGHGSMKFEPVAHNAVRSLTLMKADSNEADRVTLFFDNPVLLSDFIYLDTSGKPIVDHHGRQLLKSGVKLDISQDHHDKSDIRGIRLVPGNDKAIEVILEKSSVLKDNKTVDVHAEIPNSAGKILKSHESFKLTDARDPEATAVSVQGLNQLVVRFSEGIYDANFKIDGIFTEPGDFEVKFGEFDARNMLDNRDVATLTLKDGYDDGKHRGYFKAGDHSLQISSVRDFASLSDSANLGTTQTLNFTVRADETKPKATVKVESPEQFRLTFDKILKESADDLRSKLSIEVYDYHGKKWVKADKLRGKFTLERVGHTNEYVMELSEDWTRIYDTNRTGRNYYNDKYRIVIDKYAVTNIHNGEKNDDILLDLNYAGSPLNEPDVKSASIKSIDYSGVKDLFVVSMDEPVKLFGKDANDTPNEDQYRIPMTSVQFIGKDKYGHTVTIPGKVLGYYGEAKDDMRFLVAPDGDSLQKIVDAGGSQVWKLVVKSLSDDVGNTVATLSKDFMVEKTPVKDTPFAIAQDRYGNYLAEGHFDGPTKDIVTITFTEGVQHRGGVYDATNVMQYTLNGKTLPKGSSVSVNNYDGKDGYETVTLVLPEGTLQRSSNVIAVNQDLVSEDGSVLTGAYEVELEMDRH